MKVILLTLVFFTILAAILIGIGYWFSFHPRLAFYMPLVPGGMIVALIAWIAAKVVLG